MEVKLRPQGCLTALMIVLTFGWYLFLRRYTEGNFIRHMDEEGVVTRRGRRIAWNEFTEIKHVIGSMSMSSHGARLASSGGGRARGVKLSEEYLLKARKRRASLPYWRMTQPAEGLEYLLRHLPPDIKGLQRKG